MTRDHSSIRMSDRSPAPPEGLLDNKRSNSPTYQKGPGCDEPLLDQEEREYRSCDSEDEKSWRDVVCSRTLGNRWFWVRAVYGLTTFLALAWVFRTVFASGGDHDHSMREASAMDEDHHVIGHERIQDVDPKVIPGGVADPDGERRLIFVGDIHGCYDELMELVEKIGYNATRDHFVAAGDVISKGPHNKRVVDELLRMNAVSVRGNHEDNILAYAEAHSVTDEEVAPIEASSKHHHNDAKVSKHLKEHHFDYLKNMPLVYRIPALPRARAYKHDDDEQAPILEEILVVHAGLVPAIPLELQDAYYTMNMRSMQRKDHLPSAERAKSKHHKKTPWYEIWNWYNDGLYHGRSELDFDEVFEDNESRSTGVIGDHASPRKSVRPKPQLVVYGHDSRAGLQIHRWTKGLDSACVSGGRLTAMILDAEGRPRLESVKCKNYR